MLIALTVAQNRSVSEPEVAGQGDPERQGLMKVFQTKESLCESESSPFKCFEMLQNTLSNNKTDVSTFVTCEKQVILKLKVDVTTFLSQKSVTEEDRSQLYDSQFYAELIGIKHDSALSKLSLAVRYVTMLQAVQNLTSTLIEKTLQPLEKEYFKIFKNVLKNSNILKQLLENAYSILTISVKPTITKPTDCPVPANLATFLQMEQNYDHDEHILVG
ncbi:hypothetical protein Ciccas_003219 [Cichlidogyrus casuarinus]|uniref:Uncharacterized protein n=1 Tax=Cichlidogyrus casuarinus TaxID=1844966 RepID=A0ABD2QF64_9PLAT